MPKKMISIIAQDIRGPLGNIKIALDRIDATLFLNRLFVYYRYSNAAAGYRNNTNIYSN